MCVCVCVEREAGREWWLCVGSGERGECRSVCMMEGVYLEGAIYTWRELLVCRRLWLCREAVFV